MSTPLQPTGASGLNALQAIQARQAFGPRPAETALPETQTKAVLEESRPPQPPPTEKPGQSSFLDPALFSDIRAMAERLGYVDLSERAVERAMVLGESLLADYRV